MFQQWFIKCALPEQFYIGIDFHNRYIFEEKAILIIILKSILVSILMKNHFDGFSWVYTNNS